MRKHIAFFFCTALLALVASAHTATAREGLYRSVTVDTSAIASRGHRVLASNIRSMLDAHLRAAMPGRIGRGGAPLVVRIRNIDLVMHAGEGPGAPAPAVDDMLYGEVFVPGRGVLPIRVTLPPSSGAWYGANNDELRVNALLQAFAIWVAREV